MKNENRINFLDGLRGVAIILVMLFHAYARWPLLYSYGDKFKKFPLFAYGWLGVELFFLISGFVILMTLEKCTGFADFMLRRWLRLFPAMLACSLFIYATAQLFHERPAGIPDFRSIFPGITFIEPRLYGKIFDFPFVLEGSFWSLYVEIKFYIVFGFLYFVVGSRLAIWGLIILFGLTMVVTFTPNYLIYSNYISSIMSWLDANYYGWFASGALFYRYNQEKKIGNMLLAIFIGLSSAMLFNGLQIGTQICGLSIVLFFALSIISKNINNLLSNKIFTYMGFISYPVYLLHENMMVSLILKLGSILPWLPDITIPVIPILTVIILGSIFAFYIEPITKKLIKPGYLKFRKYAFI